MKAICFYFHIHQPFRLKKYRFFEIGNDHYYYDDFANDDIITRVARNSYIPATDMLLDLIKENGKKFKVAFSISGTAIEQLQQYVPEFIDKMKELVATGCVEFLSETFSHSLASLRDIEEFRRQVEMHDSMIYQLFGQKPKVFRNTELLYDDEIATWVAGLGMKGMVTEGAKHILGWKSPNYLYASASAPKLKLLLRNSKLTEDITVRFNNTDWESYPLTADKYMNWIADLPQEEQLINICMNYETFGEMMPRESGIFDFFRALPKFAAERNIEFWTPSEAISRLKPVSQLSVPFPMTWSGEARDASAWQGNLLQQEALNKLFSVAERVALCEERSIKVDFMRLQSSDHFYYMNTSGTYAFSPYSTPYEGFTNYMNVLSDFIVRVEEQYPLSIENEELNALLTTIRNQANEISELNREVTLMRNNIIKDDEKPLEEKAPAKKAPVKKAAPKKAAPAEKAEEAAPKAKKPAAKKTT